MLKEYLLTFKEIRPQYKMKYIFVRYRGEINKRMPSGGGYLRRICEWMAYLKLDEEYCCGTCF